MQCNNAGKGLILLSQYRPYQFRSNSPVTDVDFAFVKQNQTVGKSGRFNAREVKKC